MTTDRAFAEETGLRPYRYQRPEHGVFGSVDYIGDRLVCHLCGRDFAHLGVHVVKGHGGSVEEYRRQFGLKNTQPLASERLRRAGRDRAKAFGLGVRVGGGDAALMDRIRPAAIRALQEPRLQRTVEQAKYNDPHTLSRRRWKVPVDLPLDECPKGHKWDGMVWRGQRMCRQCNRDVVRKWRIDNPEMFKAQRIRQRARHREALGQARAANHPTEAHQWADKTRRRCRRCEAAA